MCGIAGLVRASGRATREELHRMLQAVRHRGPERLGGYVSHAVALGNARLSIVDLEGGIQPAVSHDPEIVLVFNGEIFNYWSIRESLIAKGHRFETKSEAETLLRLYADIGEEMFRRIDGQFAIAIWDGRNKSLILGRDRVGIRPLFWFQNRELLAFASEVKALFQLPSIPRKLDYRALVQTFRFWTVAGDSSGFEGVRQVPPGHYAVFDAVNASPRLTRYWEWPFPGDLECLRLASDEEYFQVFAQEFRESVDRQRMADVPVASYLSGGIDSTVVAMCLADLVPGKLRTYAVTFEDPEYDESSAQRVVADHFGFEHASVHIGPTDVSDHFRDVVFHAETPLFRTAPTPLFLLSKRVHEDGIKVVTTGEGADEILLGYDLFREVAIRNFWGRQPQSKWRGRLFSRLYAYLPQYRNPRYLNLLLDFYRATLLHDGDPHHAMAVRWNNGKALEVFLSPDMRQRADSYNPVADLESWLPQGYMAADDIARAQCIEMQTLLANYLLSSQGDRMSMAHAVEGRYPYLDHHFIEFAARLPRRLKLRGLKDKFILRNAFGNRIPEQIRKRPKMAYQAPDLKGFFVNGRAPEYVEALLNPQRLAEVGLFDSAQVTQLVKKGREFKLARVGMRDNMAFILVISTMLLDDFFVRGNGLSFAQQTSASRLELIEAGAHGPS
ncbi:MAG: asparagine synthase [Steroidobacteraceae bacterium]|nr:asparagine synthase [Steroidobacteraceae bacterium]